MFKLGKREALQDSRNLQLRAVLRADAPVLPESYDVDTALRVPAEYPMLGNDTWGDCVMVATAHQTRRNEITEQSGWIGVDPQAVVDAYLEASGGNDFGLFMLQWLKLWHSQGFKPEAGAKPYKIQAFASVERRNHEAVKSAIMACRGISIGLLLPKSSEEQFINRRPWITVNENLSGEALPNSWGGHAVYIKGWRLDGLICASWGREQFMTWSFADAYADEMWSVIDARNDGINAEKVATFLDTLR